MENICYMHVIDKGENQDYWFTIDRADLDNAKEVMEGCRKLWATNVQVFDFYYDYGELLEDNMDDIPHTWVEDPNFNGTADYEIVIESNDDLRQQHDQLEEEHMAEIFSNLYDK